MVQSERDGEFFSTLQSLRAIAAISVLLFHAAPALPSGAGFDLIKLICSHGFVGVDIFFVLSGFVVMHTASRVRSPSDSRAFALRRLGRVYLGYWPVLILGVTLSIFGVPALNPGGQWLPSALLVEPAMERNVLPVAYTLVYELWFYTFAALAFALITSERNRKQLLWATAILLVAWQGVLIATSFEAWSEGKVPLPFALSGIHLEFLAGALVYIHARRISTINMRAFGGVIVTIGVVALVLYWQWFGLTLLRALIGGAVGVGAVLIAISVSTRNETSRRKGFLERVGDASFSLYLLHTLVLAAVSFFASELTTRGSVPVEVAVIVVGVTLSVGIAMIWYRWLERPIYRRWCATVSR